MSKQIKPRKIRLEASSVCQLHCPVCPNSSNAIIPGVGKGFLPFRHFQKLLDENPWVKEVELSNYGEIFLNPDLLEMMKYAHGKKIILTADNGVNLNHARTEVLVGLVKYKFRSMMISIDGTNNETYQQYRIGGNYEAVLDNIRKINDLKKHHQSRYPVLKWQFVVFGHNENELFRAKKIADQLNMSFRVKLSWDSNISPVKNKKLLTQETGAASREEYKAKYGVDYMQNICHELWEQPQINWNGKVLGCSRNFWGDFGGNAFSDTLVESINNEKMNYAREMLTGRQAARGDIPCASCDIYLHMAKSGSWLKRGIIRRIFYSIYMMAENLRYRLDAFKE